MAETKKTAFEILNKVNVNEHTEVKDTGKVKLTYLSWAWAWAEVKKRFPAASYEIVKFNGLPYVFDEKTGYMVYTTVTIEGITHEMWLPVMDSNNRAMLSHPYDVSTSYKTFTVNPATMMDINKAIMRCLTKNLAMFGLGLYIYAGEDLPEGDDSDGEVIVQKKSQPEPTSKETETSQTNAHPKRSGARAKLKEFCDSHPKVDQQKVIKDCGLNKNSNEEDFEKAYEYALKLASEGELPFEV